MYLKKALGQDRPRNKEQAQSLLNPVERSRVLSTCLGASRNVPEAWRRCLMSLEGPHTQSGERVLALHGTFKRGQTGARYRLRARDLASVQCVYQISPCPFRLVRRHQHAGHECDTKVTAEPLGSRITITTTEPRLQDKETEAAGQWLQGPRRTWREGLGLLSPPERAGHLLLLQLSRCKL